MKKAKDKIKSEKKEEKNFAFAIVGTIIFIIMWFVALSFITWKIFLPV